MNAMIAILNYYWNYEGPCVIIWHVICAALVPKLKCNRFKQDIQIKYKERQQGLGEIGETGGGLSLKETTETMKLSPS